MKNKIILLIFILFFISYSYNLKSSDKDRICYASKIYQTYLYYYDILKKSNDNYNSIKFKKLLEKYDELCIDTITNKIITIQDIYEHYPDFNIYRCHYYYDDGLKIIVSIDDQTNFIIDNDSNYYFIGDDSDLLLLKNKYFKDLNNRKQLIEFLNILFLTSYRQLLVGELVIADKFYFINDKRSEEYYSKYNIQYEKTNNTETITCYSIQKKYFFKHTIIFKNNEIMIESLDMNEK